ncbi:MAG: DUF5714 domain-containing protein, partial [Clostridiales bacterium]
MDASVYEPFFSMVSEVCLNRFDEDRDVDLAALLLEVLDLQGLPMHCPVHHYIVPAVLLTVCRKKQGLQRQLLEAELDEALLRARNVLGGFCGLYGTCGAAVGLGIFWSIITDSNPLSVRTWGFANQATGKALLKLAEYGGPRCCKRVTWLTVSGAVAQINNLL